MQAVGSSQKSLSFRVDSQNRDKLLSRTTETRNKARLGSLQLPQAGSWLNVVPNHSLGLHLKTDEFRFATLHRLGLPVFREDGICGVCKQQSDKYGSHRVSARLRSRSRSRSGGAGVWPILLEPESEWEFLWPAPAPKLELEICEILCNNVHF